MNTAETLEVPVGVPPLAGRTLVVTRPEAQAAELVEALERLGARVVRLPTIRIAPPDDPEGLRRAVRGAGAYDWVVFTSANGVLAVRDAAMETDHGIRGAVGNGAVCCIGPATARAAEEAGLSVSLVPETHVAEGVVDALAAAASLDGQRILLPVAAGARDVLPRGLRARGAVVDVVTAYETIPVEHTDQETLELLRDGVDLVTFTSPSSVRGFDRLVEGPPPAPAAVIGPVTASAAREHGYAVTVQAGDFTVGGLVEAVVRHYEKELR
jgi:uroporphyrinogen III methyltransferase/synthase